MHYDKAVGALANALRRLRRHTPQISPIAWLRSLWHADPAAPGPLSRATRRRLAAAILVLAGAVPITEMALSGPPPTPSDEPIVAAVDSTGSPRSTHAASRGQARTPTPPGKPSAVKATRPAGKPSPVAGLTQAQMDNAAIIVEVGRKAGLPKRAYVIAVATAMQESRLLNLANPSHPESLRMPNQGIGYDFDSLGLFQQRPASGWGTPRQIMNAEYAASKFYAALMRVPGWEKLPLTVAAQAVQGSAFPDAYAKHEARARAVVDALTS